MHRLSGWALRFGTYLSVLIAIVANAHTSPGYVQWSLAEGAMTLRLTMNLTTLSDIERIDKNQDGEMAPSEIEGALPLIRDRLKELVVTYQGSQKTPIGELSEIKPLWPSLRPVRETDGVSPDACFVDLVFTSRASHSLDSVAIEFGPLLETCQNLQDLECGVTNGTASQPKQKADRTVSRLHWDLDTQIAVSLPTRDSTVPVPMTNMGWVGWIAVVLFLASTSALLWLRYKRRKRNS